MFHSRKLNKKTMANPHKSLKGNTETWYTKSNPEDHYEMNKKMTNIDIQKKYESRFLKS